MPLFINNPYQDIGTRWLRGEIHAHVDRAQGFPDKKYGDGMAASTIYKHAKRQELDFTCMSVDVTDSKGGADRFGAVGTGLQQGVTGIPAREIQNNYYCDYFKEEGADYLHVLTIGHPDGISLCAHPLYYELANVRRKGCWRDIKSALLEPEEGKCLDELNVSGIEIYNGFTRRRL